MTKKRIRLLVSVRNSEEAALAIRSGVDILDLKEPSQGSLGAADQGVINQVASIIEAENRNHPLLQASLAMGELVDRHSESRQIPAAFRYAKTGLAGARKLADWREEWINWSQGLPAHISAVAVAYADHLTAEAPSPREILRFAIDRQCDFFLIDTCCKTEGNLLSYLSGTSLQQLFRLVPEQGPSIAIAGGLKLADIQTIRTLFPDILAVRGAVCEPDRNGNLVPERIADLKRVLSVESV